MPYEPVALLDDDPGKRHLHVAGVQVRGTRRDLASVITRFGADAVVIAIADPDPELIRDVSSQAALLGVGALIVPPVAELVRSARPAGDVRDLKLDDLLGRSPAHLDEDAIAAEIAGRRVLVTGAGGSIGSEMCRQIHRLDPAALVMLDRDESALHAAQLSIYGRALLDKDDTVLADIRDACAMRRIFEACRPEVVIHAAALKHLPLLEKYPLEAWMTNVVGSWNVLCAAARSGRGHVRQHLHGQSGESDKRSRIQQAGHRTPYGTYRESRGRTIPQRSLRQCTRIPWLGTGSVRAADRGRWSGNGHSSRRHPVLHDHSRGVPTGAASRCYREAAVKRWCWTWGRR